MVEKCTGLEVVQALAWRVWSNMDSEGVKDVHE